MVKIIQLYQTIMVWKLFWICNKRDVLKCNTKMEEKSKKDLRKCIDKLKKCGIFKI